MQALASTYNGYRFRSRLKESGYRGVILWGGDIPRSSAKLRPAKRWKLYDVPCGCAEWMHYGTCHHYDVCQWAVCGVCKQVGIVPYGHPAFLPCPCFRVEHDFILESDSIGGHLLSDGHCTDTETLDAA